MNAPDNANLVCQRVRLSGVVQGVGFRSLVWRLAKELHLTGWVRNDAQGVEMEVCGPAETVRRLIEGVRQDAPPLARIDAITSRYSGSVSMSEDFFILESRGGRPATMIGQDTAVCRDCLAEMFDPEGRRWRYAFTSCLHCGPRYTLCRSLPYDRERTSLKPFAMCGKCRAEYRRPHGRRLHDESNGCVKCGPKLALLDALGKPLGGDPIAGAFEHLRAGRIVAIKGPGGFHLVGDARNPAAVALLRARKQRRAKPVPAMFANALSVTPYVQFKVGEPGLLTLPERPIILLDKRHGCDEALPGIAPDLPWLGVMLPFAPIYYLLFHEAAGRPAGLEWLDKAQETAFFVSSGNPAREPIAVDNDEATRRLLGMADAFLVHDREIVTGCDDSVAFSGLGGLQLQRRSRGYAPRAVKLPQAGPSTLAVGAERKTTVCLTRGDEAFVSQHLGDLNNPAASIFFDETIEHLLKVLDVTPTVLACDAHAETHATRFAQTLATARDIPLIGVQHHHAHIAAVLAEHRFTRPVIGLSLDGGGPGLDGALWGGELMRVEGARFERLGHIRPYRIAIGPDDETHVPWRIAAAVLHELGRGGEIAARFAERPEAAAFADELRREENDRLRASTSVGLLFDAAACLLGIVQAPVFKGQAGLLLEGRAKRHGPIAAIADGWKIENGRLDLWPLFAALTDESDPDRGAALFHATLVEALAAWLCEAANAGETIAGGGGCFHNRLMSHGLRSRLKKHGLRLIEACAIPPNDGALSLGQAWVAQHYLAD